MKIIVDAFGGDNAPLEIIKGSIGAKNEYNADIIPAAWRNFVATSSHKDKVIKEKIHNMRIKDFIPELISFQQNDI